MSAFILGTPGCSSAGHCMSHLPQCVGLRAQAWKAALLFSVCFCTPEGPRWTSGLWSQGARCRQGRRRGVLGRPWGPYDSPEPRWDPWPVPRMCPPGKWQGAFYVGEVECALGCGGRPLPLEGDAMGVRLPSMEGGRDRSCHALGGAPLALRSLSCPLSPQSICSPCLTKTDGGSVESGLQLAAGLKVSGESSVCVSGDSPSNNTGQEESLQGQALRDFCQEAPARQARDWLPGGTGCQRLSKGS